MNPMQSCNGRHPTHLVRREIIENKYEKAKMNSFLLVSIK